ncbi:hypothetical protein ERJ75_001383700 [Trypanosoma vivax]|nr:hypothetical protein ERJ75_001383700 [Trypanosoma vivax]
MPRVTVGVLWCLRKAPTCESEVARRASQGPPATSHPLVLAGVRLRVGPSASALVPSDVESYPQAEAKARRGAELRMREWRARIARAGPCHCTDDETGRGVASEGSEAQHRNCARSRLEVMLERSADALRS